MQCFEVFDNTVFHMPVVFLDTDIHPDPNLFLILARLNFLFCYFAVSVVLMGTHTQSLKHPVHAL